MLRRFLLAAMLACPTASAMGADLPARMSPVAPVLVAPAFTWTGFYAGLNAGAAFNNQSRSYTSAGGFFLPDPYVYPGGKGDAEFTGGVQAGYNMQFGSFVAGLEGDINYLGNRSGGGSFPPPVDVGPGYDNRTDFVVNNSGAKWFATVRGRLGFAFDKALIYGTGGIAFSGGRNMSMLQRDYFENCTPAGAGCPANGTFGIDPIRELASTGSKSSSAGWTLGGGAEYAFTNALSLKLEYLHVDLGHTTQTFTTLASVTTGTMAAGNTITVRQSNKFDVVRMGVNYRF